MHLKWKRHIQAIASEICIEIWIFGIFAHLIFETRYYYPLLKPERIVVYTEVAHTCFMFIDFEVRSIFTKGTYAIKLKSQRCLSLCKQMHTHHTPIPFTELSRSFCTQNSNFTLNSAKRTSVTLHFALQKLLTLAASCATKHSFDFRWFVSKKKRTDEANTCCNRLKKKCILNWQTKQTNRMAAHCTTYENGDNFKTNRQLKFRWRRLFVNRDGLCILRHQFMESNVKLDAV